MAREKFQGWTVDGNGKVILSATVAVYLSGTTTAASVYSASSGGTAVNSVTSSATDGSFSFYVDTSDYATSQRFKLVISKTNYDSLTVDALPVFHVGIT